MASKEEQNLVDLLRQVGELQGWEALDLSNPAYKELDKARRQAGESLSRAFYETFRTPSGKVVMDWLIARYILRPPVAGDETELGVGLKEGKSDLVREILLEYEKGSNIQ